MKILRTCSLILAMVVGVSCASVGTEDKGQQAVAHYKLGAGYLSEGRVQQAFVEFHKALEFDPRNKEVLNAIGIIYLLHFDEPVKSMEYFDRAGKLDKDYSEAFNNLGYAYERAGKYEEAIAFYQKALSNPLYSTAEKSFLNLGNAYYRLKRYEPAMASIKEAIKRRPDLSLAYLRLALCYNALGRYGDAALAMTQAIKLDQTYKGNREQAAEDFNLRRLKAMGPEEQDIRDYLEILKY